MCSPEGLIYLSSNDSVCPSNIEYVCGNILYNKYTSCCEKVYSFLNKSSNKFQANTSLPSVVYLKSEFNHILVKTRSWTALSVNQVQMAGSVKFEAGAGRQEGGAPCALMKIGF